MASPVCYLESLLSVSPASSLIFSELLDAMLPGAFLDFFRFGGVEACFGFRKLSCWGDAVSEYRWLHLGIGHLLALVLLIFGRYYQPTAVSSADVACIQIERWP